MNIIEQVLTIISSSTVSGITWDILKISGDSIIRSFKQKFLKSNIFKSEKQTEEYLERVLNMSSSSIEETEEITNKIFQKITGNNKEKIFLEFLEWAK